MHNSNEVFLYLHGLPIPKHVMESMQNTEQYFSTFKVVEHTFTKQFNVINVKFKHDNPILAIATINELCKQYNVKFIVANSMGGYLSFRINKPTILINPVIQALKSQVVLDWLDTLKSKTVIAKQSLQLFDFQILNVDKNVCLSNKIAIVGSNDTLLRVNDANKVELILGIDKCIFVNAGHIVEATLLEQCLLQAFGMLKLKH